jgi:hypothetical protein
MARDKRPHNFHPFGQFPEHRRSVAPAHSLHTNAGALTWDDQMGSNLRDQSRCKYKFRLYLGYTLHLNLRKCECCQVERMSLVVPGEQVDMCNLRVGCLLP